MDILGAGYRPPAPKSRSQPQKSAVIRRNAPPTDQLPTKIERQSPSPHHQRVWLSAKHSRAPCQRFMLKTSRSQSAKITIPNKAGITRLMSNFRPILSVRYDGTRRALFPSASKLVEIIL